MFGYNAQLKRCAIDGAKTLRVQRWSATTGVNIILCYLISKLIINFHWNSLFYKNYSLYNLYINFKDSNLSSVNLSDFDLTKESSIEPNPPPSLFAIGKSQKLFPVYVSLENNEEFSYQKCNPIKITKNGNFSFSVKCANRESRAAVACGGTAVISFREKVRLRIVQYFTHKMVDFSQYLLKL